jgi:hypothetical protein
MMILVLSRAIDSAINMGEANGIVPKSKHKYLIIWVFASTFLQCCMSFQQDLLNKGLFKFYYKWAFLSNQDQALCITWGRMLDDRVPYF